MRGKPLTYKVVCFSLYHEDVARLEKMVDRARAAGEPMNKSKLVREALKRLDLDELLFGGPR